MKYKKISLIKIDVEGAEWDVLQGMKSLLAKLPDYAEIIIEISPERLFSQNKKPQDVMDILRGEGFYP